MKSIFSLLLLASALTANAQQVNGTFAKWNDCTPWLGTGVSSKTVGKNPAGWCISHIAGYYVPILDWQGSQSLGEETTGQGGNKAVLLENKVVFGVPAPAYLTLGTTWNTASTSKSYSDGGTWGGISFNFKPDAISFNYKRSEADASKAQPATVVAYLWKGTFKQDEVPTNIATVSKRQGDTRHKETMVNRDRSILNMSTDQGGNVSEKGTLLASKVEKITNVTDKWINKVVSIDYTNVDETPDMFNIIFAANDYFGKKSDIVVGNTFSVENVQLLYYHYLKSVSYDGQKLTSTASDTLTFDMSTVEYDNTKELACVKGGVGSTVDAPSYDKTTGKLTINVKGNDYAANDKSITTYTIQFKAPEQDKVTTTLYKNSLFVDPHAMGTQQMTLDNEIKLNYHEKSGQYDLLLENFEFGGISVGDVLVENLTKTDVGTQTLFTSENTPVQINLMGKPTKVLVNVNATVENGKMTANIQIPLSGSVDDIDQLVNVVFAPHYDINASSGVVDIKESGLANITMLRSFKKGWNTVCLPFTITSYDLTGGDYYGDYMGTTNAQSFVSSNQNSLTFDAVKDDQLEANIPYLVYFSEDLDYTDESPFYYGGKVEVTNPTPVEHSGFTFVGNYEASKSMQGLYGVASEGDVQKIMLGTASSTLPATCAYFTTKNLNANGLRICFDGGEVTGINQVNGAQAQSAGAVYNLQGIKVSNHGTNNLPAGLYIMQGKKVIVK